MHNLNKMGPYIRSRRKQLGLSQQELAHKLHISFQAVSKWETGESYPDVSILLDLSQYLETSIDKLLTGGEILLNKHSFIHLSDIKEGLNALKHMKQAFGEHSLIYQGAMKGIKESLNLDIETYLNDALKFEVLFSEIIIQYILEGYMIDASDLDTYIESTPLKTHIMRYLSPSQKVNQITQNDHPHLFNQIHSFHDDLKGITKLSEIPGEFITLEPGKLYYGSEVEISETLCYGVAADESMLYIFTYGKHGSNHQKVYEASIKKL